MCHIFYKHFSRSLIEGNKKNKRKSEQVTAISCLKATFFFFLHAYSYATSCIYLSRIQIRLPFFFGAFFSGNVAVCAHTRNLLSSTGTF